MNVLLDLKKYFPYALTASSSKHDALIQQATRLATVTSIYIFNDRASIGDAENIVDREQVPFAREQAPFALEQAAFAPEQVPVAAEHAFLAPEPKSRDASCQADMSIAPIERRGIGTIVDTYILSPSVTTV